MRFSRVKAIRSTGTFASVRVMRFGWMVSGGQGRHYLRTGVVRLDRGVDFAIGCGSRGDGTLREWC
ncbi:hypothetical protein SHIRM173S_09200 [Streptomyces hirsutus]